MPVVTHLGAAWTTTAGNKTVTATPTASCLIVIITGNSGRTTAQTPTLSDDQADSSGYTLLGVQAANTSVDHIAAFARNKPIPAASSTVFTMTQSSDTGGGLSVFQVAPVNQFGSPAARGTFGTANQTAGTPSLTITAPLARNPLIAGVINATNSTTTTAPPTGWTEAFDNGYNTPPTGLETCFISIGETRTTIPWTGASASTFATIMVEVECSRLGRPLVVARRQP